MPASPIVSPADVVKIIAFTQNPDGTLSPTALVAAGNPVISPADAQAVWFFSQNGDGTLSSTSLA